MSTVESFNRERGQQPCVLITLESRFTIHRVSVANARKRTRRITSLGGSTTLPVHGNDGNCVSRVRRAPCVQIALRGCILNSSKRARPRAKTADTKLRSRVPGESPFKSGRVSFGTPLFATYLLRLNCDFDGALICRKKRKEGRNIMRYMQRCFVQRG